MKMRSNTDYLHKIHMADLFEGTKHDCGFAASQEQVCCRDEALELLKKYYFDLWC